MAKTTNRARLQGVVMRATLPQTCATCDYDLYSVRIKYGVSAITKCPRCGELNRLIVDGSGLFKPNAQADRPAKAGERGES